AHQLLLVVGQTRQFAAGYRSLLGGGADLDDQVVDFVDVAVDLLGHQALFLGSRRHLDVAITDAGNAVGDFYQQLASSDHIVGAGLRLVQSFLHGAGGAVGAALQVADHLLDADGGVLGLLRQLTNLDRKSVV